MPNLPLATQPPSQPIISTKGMPIETIQQPPVQIPPFPRTESSSPSILEIFAWVFVMMLGLMTFHSYLVTALSRK